MGLLDKISGFFKEYKTFDKVSMFDGLPNTVPADLRDAMGEYDFLSLEDIKQSCGLTDDEDAKAILCLDRLAVNQFIDAGDRELIKMILKTRYKYSEASAERICSIFQSYHA